MPQVVSITSDYLYNGNMEVLRFVWKCWQRIILIVECGNWKRHGEVIVNAERKADNITDISERQAEEHKIIF